MQQAAVYVRPEHQGVIYGFRSFGDFGDDANIYYFGRTRQACVYNMSLDGLADGVHMRQKKMLKDKCRCTGLNSPSRVLLWGRTATVNKDWDDLRDFLRGNRNPLPGASDPRTRPPLLTNQLWVGDNWFTCKPKQRA